MRGTQPGETFNPKIRDTHNDGRESEPGELGWLPTAPVHCLKVRPVTIRQQ